MRLTPREFSLLIYAEQERMEDEKENEAHYALMHRVATNKEKVKITDLYERSKSSVITELRGEAFESEVENHLEVQDFIKSLQFEEEE